MPTFTAIAFDRLIEPRAAKSMAPTNNSPDPMLERRHSNPIPSQAMERGATIPLNTKLERGVSVPPPNGKIERGVSVPYNPNLDRRTNGSSSSAAANTSFVDKKHHWTQISPALYATPESTPLPDSPSSFPPSPYIINHKRRGPRLMKSFSEDDVATWKQAAADGVKVDENGKEEASVSKDECSGPLKVLDSTTDGVKLSDPVEETEGMHLNGACDNKNLGSIDMENDIAVENGVTKSVAFNMKLDVEVDDFVDPQDSMSVMSVEERSMNSTTPMAEFYDAWEELSSESGPQLPIPDIESELREMRLSLLMEIGKRKQAEENLNNMRNQWQRMREHLSHVGLTLPVDPCHLEEGEQPADVAAEVCQQIYLARFVSNSIGRGIAKAEAEMEMEAQIKVKNFEITRLLDRLRYYEAVNQEMSQRNQEVVETARRLRQRRKRRQKWVWGSAATALTLGSAILAYSYFHTGKGSSSSQTPSHSPKIHSETK